MKLLSVVDLTGYSYSYRMNDTCIPKLVFKYFPSSSINVALRRVIPVVCVTNEREESVVNQHNLFRKMLYSNNETTCFGL